jgi:hypothetical protein
LQVRHSDTCINYFCASCFPIINLLRTIMYNELKLFNDKKIQKKTFNECCFSLTWHDHCYPQCKYINDSNDGADDMIVDSDNVHDEFNDDDYNLSNSYILQFIDKHTVRRLVHCLFTKCRSVSKRSVEACTLHIANHLLMRRLIMSCL